MFEIVSSYGGEECKDWRGGYIVDEHMSMESWGGEQEHAKRATFKGDE